VAATLHDKQMTISRRPCDDRPVTVPHAYQWSTDFVLFGEHLNVHHKKVRDFFDVSGALAVCVRVAERGTNRYRHRRRDDFHLAVQLRRHEAERPRAVLVQATDGNLYGTTVQGGANCPPYGCGTIFKITPSGTLTTLRSFNGTDGADPEAGLIQATDGNFYGTTSRGGANKLCPPRRTVTCGTVFKITPSGTLTTLASFGEEGGSDPFSPLIQATDGNFYGTTPSAVFKVTPSGTLMTLAFVSSSYAGLVQATDGNFYGTMEYGGNAATCDGGCGTVFKVTPSGTLATLLSFTNSANPVAALIQATDGNLYGTTGVGGANNDCGGSGPGPIGCGMVFKATLGGTLTRLFSFDARDGDGPQAPLVQATNGDNCRRRGQRGLQQSG
jgi:uncharacterized repeat protein (TIGR03803 family)